ncbi:MAG: cell filamentation protein Fic [Desulfobulbaceae bacterium]|nr:MAG: cell filamentation protein Fic [Desulfobulbaceae bacterium]
MSNLKKAGRYKTSGLAEDQFEPGSSKRVLRNLLGLKRKRDADEAEAREQIRALDEFLTTYGQDHRFSSADICEMHEIWLGEIYEWAGKYRQVNISKGGFFFAAARQIPQLMELFEREQLRVYTPCNFIGEEKVVEALAVVHTELVLIHPFREGNGRLARMLAIIMGLQAGLPPLNFSMIKGARKQAYFAAVQAGMDMNYEPMKEIFRSVVKLTFSEAKKL